MQTILRHITLLGSFSVGILQYGRSHVFLFWSKAGKFKIDKNLQPKQRKKREYCHSSQRNYQKKLKKRKFYLHFKDAWLKKTNILRATILDKTVVKIVYLDSIFLNIVAVPVLPSPPSPESNVVVYSKESLIPGRLWEATLNWGKGFSFLKGVVLEIVLLRRKVDMMAKTFSSSFVRDCI